MKFSSLNGKNILTSIKFFIAMPMSRLVYHGTSHWIITERYNQARDNGFIFFKYLCEKHPECNPVYIIDKQSADYEKIKDLGRVVQFNSWQHFLLFCASKVHISAHVGGCSPSHSPILKHIKRKLKYQDVFIPHGVSYGISEFCLKKYAKINLFICSGKQEYENVLTNYGYDESEVAYTGFPRLDEWHGSKPDSKQILLMPTWRLYLAQNDNTVFEETEFFKAYQSLINSKELDEWLEKEDKELIFYLHHNMKKYESFFTTYSDRIHIIRDDSEYDIQQLLKDSSMLITDYSSVHFDFAYMNKPVLYYQFDQDEFYRKQYQKSLFNFESDGFGPICSNENDLIALIRNLSKQDKLEVKYYSRMRRFYELYDNKNCERVFNAIKK